MKHHPVFLTAIAGFASASLLLTSAQANPVSAVTDPVGVVSFDLPRGSDTLIATPLAKPAVYKGPSTSVSGFTINFPANTNLPNLTNAPHYVKAVEGPQAGIIFDVVANTGTSVTVFDNGISPTSFGNGTKVEIIPYWTLVDLFPPSDAGVSFTASPSVSNRRTQILLPDISGTGINRVPSSVFFFVEGTFWRSAAAVNENANNVPIPPDSYFIVRNPADADPGLRLGVSGSVSLTPLAIQLDSLSSGPNDNYVACASPVPVKLRDLGLHNSGAFQPSSSLFAPLRRGDMLLTFDNSRVAVNRSASQIYFYLDDGVNQGWRSARNPSLDAGDDLIQPGSALVIRKFRTPTETTTFWNTIVNISN